MFPSFSSLSDRSKKHQQLIDRLSLESRIDKTKDKAYSQAYISPDTFSLDPLEPTTSVGIQTDISTSTSISSSDPEPNSDRSQDESALMGAEDVRSQFLRYETKLEQMYDQATHAINQTMRAYEHLNNQHILSQRENDMLRRDFEDGRQLYLRLQREKERIKADSEGSTRQLNDLKDDYYQLGELYTILQSAYKSLQHESKQDRSDLEQLIANLRAVGAEETAKVVAAHNRIRDLEIDTNNLVQLIQNMQSSHNELNQNLYRAEVAYNQLLEDNWLTKSENASLSMLQKESTDKLNALLEKIETLKRKDRISDIEKRELSLKLIAADEKINELDKQVADYEDTIATTRSAAKVGKKERSPNNTPDALLKFMIDRGVKEVSAANPKGMLSPSAKFVVKDGKLYSRTGKGDKLMILGITSGV
jgi:chromosome segregation ATPase